MNILAKRYFTDRGFSEENDVVFSDDFEIKQLPSRPGDIPNTMKNYFSINGRIFRGFPRFVLWMHRNNLLEKDRYSHQKKVEKSQTILKVIPVELPSKRSVKS